MSLSKLGRYNIVRVLGKGAMGTVYEAIDPHLERRVAIKTIAVQGLSDEGARDYEIRFRTEAHSCARLQHPHIVSVYDAGRDGETAYLVMEYVEGQDLKYHLDQGVRFTLDQTLRIMRELLSALAYAHAQNVVHRDVKPGNLLIEANGRVKLSDFGVARIQDAGDATRTRGLMVGTLKYMSPEQVQGQSVDPRADLFSAGIVLYQLLTGRQPFVGDSEFAIIAQIVGVDPPAPSAIHPTLPAAIDAVVACALAKDCEQRYASAQAFDDALALACGLASDRSTVPPPGLMGLGSGAIARTSPSFIGPVGVSTVTQELELVYWKDVRDSDDALDLQGFLDRFPGGIYADLARRKLRKLGVVFVGEQTATRVEPRVVCADALAEPVGAGHPAPQADQSRGIHTQRRSRQSIATVLTGVAVVLVAAAGIRWWFSGEPSIVGSTTTTTQPMASLPAPGVSVAPVSAHSESALAATAPPQDLNTAAAIVPPTAPRTPATTAVANRTNDRAAAKMSSTPSETAGPERACAGRILLGYQICLSQQCARPIFAGHPLCEQRRAAEQARRQQQSNRN